MPRAIGDFNPSDHEAEAAERWPDTFELSKQRTARYTEQQWREAAAEQAAIAERFASVLASGVLADSPDSMDIAEEHRASIDRWYYSCSKGMHTGLADMYLADPRFRGYWEARAPGLAEFVHDSIYANALR